MAERWTKKETKHRTKKNKCNTTKWTCYRLSESVIRSFLAHVTTTNFYSFILFFWFENICSNHIKVLARKLKKIERSVHSLSQKPLHDIFSRQHFECLQQSQWVQTASLALVLSMKPMLLTNKKSIRLKVVKIDWFPVTNSFKFKCRKHAMP